MAHKGEICMGSTAKSEYLVENSLKAGRTYLLFVTGNLKGKSMILRKKTSNFAAIVGLLVSLFVANPSPASAIDSLGGHVNGSVENLSLGVPADLDYSCLTDGTDIYLENQGWTVEPTLPPGLSYDPITHHISGTPTQAGQYGLPNMVCNVFETATQHVMSSVHFSAGSIAVSDPTPPPPADVAPAANIILDPLNDDGCRFAMTLNFPQGSDERSVVVQFVSGASYVVIHGADLNNLSHWITGPSDVQYLATEFPEDWTYNGERGGSNMSCGEELAVSVDYTINGVHGETATARVRPISAPNFLSADLYTENNLCKVEIEYHVSFTPFNDNDYQSPVYIDVSSPNSARFVVVMNSSEFGDDGTIWLDLTNKEITLVMKNGIPEDISKLDAHSTGSFNCGDSVGVDLIASTFPGDEPRTIEDVSADGLSLCGKGTFGESTLGFQDGEPCVEAPVGSFVDTIGATEAKPCPGGMTTSQAGSASANDCFYPAAACGKGTFSPSGHDLADAPCMDAPIGSYVSIKGAMSATECSLGMTTEEPGAASRYDCFKPAAPTIAKLKTPKIAKFGVTLTLSSKTDQGTNLNITATGACRVLSVPAGVTQNFKVTMAKKAGTCKLTIFAKQHGRFTSLTKVLIVKVTKTGK